MKKVFSKLLVLVIASALIIGIFPNSLAEAADYKYDVVTLKEKASTGTFKQGKYSSGAYYYSIFKVEVKKDGYLTITDKSENPGSIEVYDCDINTVKANVSDYSLHDEIFRTPYDTEKSYVPVEAGTYYLVPTTYGDVKFEYTFTEVDIKRTNFYRKKADKLKENKVVTVVQPNGYEADLWFEVSLSKNKTLTIDFEDLSYSYSYLSLYVYDENGESYKMIESDGTSLKSSKTLDKGKYYIKIRQASGMSNPTVYKLKLKK